MSATTKRLIIGGMTCPHCQARVQQALLGVPGRGARAGEL